MKKARKVLIFSTFGSVLDEALLFSICFLGNNDTRVVENRKTFHCRVFITWFLPFSFGWRAPATRGLYCRDSRRWYAKQRAEERESRTEGDQEKESKAESEADRRIGTGGPAELLTPPYSFLSYWCHYGFLSCLSILSDTHKKIHWRRSSVVMFFSCMGFS